MKLAKQTITQLQFYCDIYKHICDKMHDNIDSFDLILHPLPIMHFYGN